MDQEQLVEFIELFIENDPGNAVLPTKIYEKPLVAFAAADDPLFAKLQESHVVGPEHRLPGDWLAGAKTVISYFLPYPAELCKTNHAGERVSPEFQYARFYGEDINDRLRRKLVNFLNNAGYLSVAPILEKEFQISNMPGQLKSNWSERHAAFIAGHGSFGLHWGIITKKGVAGRFGSVVTTLDLEPTAREYEELYAHCPYFNGGLCDACLKRCPCGALQHDGKSKDACFHHLRHTEKEYAHFLSGFPFSCCGKCIVHIPCEKERPG